LMDASYPMAVGIAMGLLGAMLATRWVRSLLYETSPADPVVIGSGMAILIVAALLASLLPARNAAATDPMHVLRGE
jgi:ABC-type lipoprotein release transport system permease subunit